MHFFNFALHLLLFTIFKGVTGLRDVKVTVPEAVRLGQHAVLSCSFQLDGESLYTVKWYKGGREFFRYTPKENPSLKIFSMPGLGEEDIAKEYSNATHVWLKNVTQNMTGNYDCEVSADAPSFHTAVMSAHMHVVDPPHGRPILIGLKARYRLGDIITANCTSPKSRPAANLTWVLNGKSVDRKHVKQYRKAVEDDLEMTILTIRMQAKSSHFPGGTMKLKCTASFHSLYWQTTEKAADLDRPRIQNEVVEHPPSRNNMIPPTHTLIDNGYEKSEPPTSGLNSICLDLCLITISVTYSANLAFAGVNKHLC
ncbi:uncharacterized protein LOC106667703 [Cimex lectularius]|uniref:Ig-like domain-containing protein n=1 Tax=Cimex lectularius TaxID=79782 RepID=A0A8I6S0N8_CIMLE|nr:uncharacterized protein LOC106667703 [Cimex lectularius]